MKNLCLILFLILTITISPGLAADKESVYERIIRTGEIRCGWGSWDPIILKDPNTGQMSGIFYEYMNELGTQLNLKIIWSEEIGWGDFGAALQNNRIDAMCSGIWPIATRARSMDFTIPIYYSAMYAYVRADDTRFDQDLLSVANNQNITFSGQDGIIAYKLALQLFPKAQKIVLPQISPQTEILTMVAQRKTDITISDRISASLYMEKNPEKLKQVITDKPLGVFGNTIAIKTGENELRRMLDNATKDLINRGIINQIVSKYEKFEGSLYRISSPYEER